MSYCNIIQLEKYPIEETSRISCDTIQDCEDNKWFFVNVADYVREDEESDETIDAFINFLQSFEPFVEVFSDEKEKWIVFKEGFTQAYFENLYPQFEEALQNLVKKTSVETLCKKYEMSGLIYPLRALSGDGIGTYVDNGEMGLISLPSFIRRIEPNVKYYIGSTVEYHC